MLFNMVTNSNKLHEMQLDERQNIFSNINSIKKTVLDENITRPNIENFIGAIQVPLGIAGPISVNGDYAKGSFYLPLATTEGALVASVSRGCKVINESGGANVLILKNEQTRSILFKVKSVKEIKRFENWINENFEELKNVAEKDDKFLVLKKIDFYSVGYNIWLRLKADTADAMGMNMLTIAGKKIADYIVVNYNENIEFICESGNLCVDKKPSAMNLINGRGKKVTACVNISDETILKMLKTTSEKLIDLNYRKNLLGSASSGSLGFNAHFANIIAAIFIATGQDVAHTVDGSLGFTLVEKNDNGVNFSVTLPDLQVATVGGGTSLSTQIEALSILGVEGSGNPPGNNSKKLAEIIACAVLAGEISLLGALCSKELSKAHKELNR